MCFFYPELEELLGIPEIATLPHASVSSLQIRNDKVGCEQLWRRKNRSLFQRSQRARLEFPFSLLNGTRVTVSVRGVRNRPQDQPLVLSEATALPEALGDGTANGFSPPDSLNTKKKQLPPKHRNRKYSWMGTENWSQPLLEMGRRSEPSSTSTLAQTTPVPPAPHPFTNKEQSHKVCEKTSWRSFILRRVNKDSGLPSPYFFHHKQKKKKKRRRGKREAAQRWPSRQEGVEGLWTWEVSSRNDTA